MFCPDCLTVDQLYTLSKVNCFGDLDYAFDHVPQGVLWVIVLLYAVSGPLIGPSASCMIGVRAC